jgi:hypothetical protein
MPVTPFHLGPGLLGKAFANRYFSFLAFAMTQVVIDVETAYHLLRHEWPLHRGLHTMLLGTAVGILVGLLWYAAGRNAAGRLRRLGGGLLVRWHECDLVPALIGGACGGASHSLLDGLMHSDVQPFSPWVAGNPLLGKIDLAALHVSCVVAGALGMGILLIHAARERHGS